MLTEKLTEDNHIAIYGARVHNLKNVDLLLPRDNLIVITGISGSGKSSLAFDTIYAEGQRRYMETLSAYARQFLGTLERPDVDKITGLSPVISIEQKTTNKNPRSTVGTTTEIYDFLRLLYARAADAFSYNTGEKMVQYTDNQINELILGQYGGKKIYILAPLVKNRKGHYKELFEQVLKKGFLHARVDGDIIEISHGLRLDRYKNHSIEIVIDKLEVKNEDLPRLKKSIVTAMSHGKGTIMIVEKGNAKQASYYSRNMMCPSTGISYNEPAPHDFSFNSPQGACQHCNGLGWVSEVDYDKIIPNSKLSIKQGGIKPLGKQSNSLIFWQLESITKRYGFSLSSPINKIPDEALKVIIYGSEQAITLENTPLGTSSNYALSYDGIITYLENRSNGPSSKNTNKHTVQFVKKITCPQCHGQRLNNKSLHFKIEGKNIAEISELDIRELFEWLNTIESKLTKRQMAIAKEILKELRTRVSFLLDVGLDYLSLNLPSKSLSGGESQRIRLATQIGSQLVNVLYILDEPSIGLHQRDNEKLIASLRKLKDAGNSIIVVEHDLDMMLSADYLVDVGPKAGRYGGEIVAAGPPNEVLKTPDSLTAKFLRKEEEIIIPKSRRKGNGNRISVFGAIGHNLKKVTAHFPLGTFICVTGVSGSGKSSLVNETLYPALSQYFYRSVKQPLPHAKIEGLKNIDKVIEVNQSPLGRTPRSNPATYTGVFSDIRSLFAQTTEAKIRGYKPGRFSFNVKGGRCETCQGSGMQTIEMNFLPDVYVLCKECNGRRYNRETLEVKYKGRNINEVLEMTINQAVDFFENVPSIRKKLDTLKEVGLGYIKLGQPSTTLSGGESQRVKLSSELSKKDTGSTFYILDEPTTGLHFHDIKVLLNVIEKLVDKGNTVVIIEHNLDVIKSADYIIDMGKEGGKNGGEVLFSGTPEQLASINDNYTAHYLRKELEIHYSKETH